MNLQRTASYGYDSQYLHTSTINIETCLKFREKFAIDKRLVTDAWDAHSEHIGFFYKETLIATLRIVHPHEFKLPVNEYAPELPIDKEDLQIGRLVVDQRLVNRLFLLFFYKYFGEVLIPMGRRMYIAAVQDGPISHRRYCSLGFRDTGCKYYDSAYGKSLQIFVRLNGDNQNNLFAS